jgi:hypothetical protein
MLHGKCLAGLNWLWLSLTFALMAAFQWFFTAFSVRPSSLRVMRAAAVVRKERAAERVRGSEIGRHHTRAMTAGFS